MGRNAHAQHPRPRSPRCGSYIRACSRPPLGLLPHWGARRCSRLQSGRKSVSESDARPAGWRRGLSGPARTAGVADELARQRRSLGRAPMVAGLALLPSSAPSRASRPVARHAVGARRRAAAPRRERRVEARGHRARAQTAVGARGRDPFPELGRLVPRVGPLVRTSSGTAHARAGWFTLT